MAKMIDCGTPTADLLTVKLLFNSIVSTPNAKFMSIDISNFYLNTPLDRYEYVRMKLANFPPDMIEQYSDSFSTSYLNYFLKSMERQIITMKLSKVIRCLPPPASHSRPASQSRHASPHIVSHRLLLQDKPLILHYPLGADMSYICFVLAPKTSTGE